MEVPFDRIVMAAPRPLQFEGLGTHTKLEQRVFGSAVPDLIWEQTLLPWVARNSSVLFCPTYTSPILRRNPTVVANHGIYEAVPGEFSWWARVRATPINRLSAQRATRVIANSLSTKQDLQRFFHVSEDRLDVLYPAANEIFFEQHAQASIERAVIDAFGAMTRYVIFVGKLAKRRNVPNLIRALAQVRREKGVPHRLLIVGPNTTDVDVNEVATEAGIASEVTYIPYLEQEPLAKLYAGADVYALPTTYEGISQTMFEAMASGVPVLTVDHPTLEEGAGDAVLSMPTPSVENLAEGLSRLLTNEALRREYAAKGRARATRFSWRFTAQRTLEILSEVALAQDRDSNRAKSSSEAEARGAGG